MEFKVYVYCNRCGHEVKRETDKDLKKEYKYFCENCYENLYDFETYKAIECKEEN